VARVLLLGVLELVGAVFTKADVGHAWVGLWLGLGLLGHHASVRGLFDVARAISCWRLNRRVRVYNRRVLLVLGRV